MLEALWSSKMAERYFSSARASQGKTVLKRFHQANFNFILFLLNKKIRKFASVRRIKCG